jgi:hypothetical protein
MGRYVSACGGNTKKAMTLYRRNLQLSQELFTLISCFEVALRNAIDQHYTSTLGDHWLRNASAPGGRFNTSKCRFTQVSINDAIHKLNHSYTHNKLIAELGFGFWRYMFAKHQYSACGKTLLRIFPAKPKGVLVNQNFIFKRLADINDLRNRIAHHEPVCFVKGLPVKDSSYVRVHYDYVMELFRWLCIDEAARYFQMLCLKKSKRQVCPLFHR